MANAIEMIARCMRHQNPNLLIIAGREVSGRGEAIPYSSDFLPPSDRGIDGALPPVQDTF